MSFINIIITLICVFTIYKVAIVLYFKSSKFIALRSSIQNHIIKCNELNEHIENLKATYSSIEAPDYGTSQLQDTSRYNMRRKEWHKTVQNSYTHNCSATVCKNASSQPFKYLCKYFNIKPNEKTLENFEEILNNFSASEEGKILLLNERNEIVNSISNSIPAIIKWFNRERIIKELGFKHIDLSTLYFPVYTFQYVSAGGNSSAKCDIKLDLNNLERFVAYLAELVKFRKSVAGQRALMTERLRQQIKYRDNYTCRICGISTADERNLLLEIDHIIPLSKGGITSEDNLQTLCWKCNRSKGSRIL